MGVLSTATTLWLPMPMVIDYIQCLKTNLKYHCINDDIVGNARVKLNLYIKLKYDIQYNTLQIFQTTKGFHHMGMTKMHACTQEYQGGSASG